MDELGHLIADFQRQDIKTESMTLDQIEEMKSLSGSYESLFSRKAMKFRSMGLGEKNFSESDYRQFIYDEYTFLKRPVFIIGDQIFIGNSKSTIEKLKTALT